jgi:hypothetical protein
MIAVLDQRRKAGILRHSRWDALLLILAAAHGFILLAYPSAVVIAVGVWWNSNTISHYFIHCPFFRNRTLNRLFGLYLSLLLGVPQTLWRERHLAHHADREWRLRLTRPLLAEVALIGSLWAILVWYYPRFFFTAYLPGYAVGLLLCTLHGYYEHVRGTISHYGRLYNWLFFNDGFHVEHHARPSTHWTRLPATATERSRGNGWPAVLRWLDGLSLDGLERWVLRCGCLQRFVLAKHERAFRALLPRLPPIRRVGIVGGGLYPRTALICRRVLPDAAVVVIDADADNIATARLHLAEGVDYVNAWFDPERHFDYDLLVFPLAYVGNREAVYRRPTAPAVLIHDWMWHWRRPGVLVSLLLCKRLNLVLQ